MPAIHHRSRPRILAVALTIAVGVASLAACTSSGGSDSDSAAKKGSGDGGGTVVGSGNRYEATIRRTSDGVPHITGKTVADAAFGQGYVVGWGSNYSIMDPALRTKSTFFTADSPLRTIDGKTGYFVNNGTSFLMAVAFGPDGPKAQAFLTYSDTENRKDPNYTAATERFSKKNWRTVDFTEAQVAADTKSTTTVKG